MSGGYAPSPYAELIYIFFTNRGLSPISASGFMGTIYGESHFYPVLLESDFWSTAYSQGYTQDVDNLVITENQFVHASPLPYPYAPSGYITKYFGTSRGLGYGLVQWTSSGRKQGLYTYWRQHANLYPSIGSLQLQLNYIWEELNSPSYVNVLNYLMRTDISIYDATKYTLNHYEGISDEAGGLSSRYKAALHVYNDYGGSTPPDPPEPYDPPIPIPPPPLPPYPGYRKFMPPFMYHGYKTWYK